MKIEEDKTFLLQQRMKRRPGIMVSVDKKLADQEAKNADRLLRESRRKATHQMEMKNLDEKVTLTSSSSSASNTEAEDDLLDACAGPSTSVSPSKRARKSIINPSVAAALDRSKVSDRKAVQIVATAASSLGIDASEYTVSRSLFRRQRMKHREEIATTLKAKFNPASPLVIHWDGKMMTDIIGKKVVDRLPVLVSALEGYQLLGVPKVAGTGRSMADAVSELA